MTVLLLPLHTGTLPIQLYTRQTSHCRGVDEESIPATEIILGR